MTLYSPDSITFASGGRHVVYYCLVYEVPGCRVGQCASLLCLN